MRRIVQFGFGPTAKYRDRRAVWVPGAREGDGHLVISVYPQRGLPETAAYAVQWTDEGVVVWKAGGGRQRYYRVTAGWCSCDGMRKREREECKHLGAVRGLVRAGVFRCLPPGDFDRVKKKVGSGVSGSGSVAGG